MLGISLLGGCVTASKSPKNTTSAPRGETFPLLPPENVELSPVIPNLDRSGGLTFSTDGILYFANYLQSGTIGMHQVGQSQSPETFIDLTQWMTSYGDRTPRAHGMRIDGQGRLVVAEAGTGKVIRIYLLKQKRTCYHASTRLKRVLSNVQGNWKSLQILSMAFRSEACVTLLSDLMEIFMPVHLVQELCSLFVRRMDTWVC